MRLRTALTTRLLTPHLWRRPTLVAALSATLAVPMLAMVGPAQAVDATKVGPRDPSQHGFPGYYTDDAGVALQLCDDGTAACLSTGPAELAPADGEGFYFNASTDVSAPGIDISIEYAVEAAWLSATQPITFDRLRIRGHSDSAGDIVVTTPYGPVTVTADDPTEQRNINFTEDVGCSPLPSCNFADLAGSPNAHITDWITSTTPPAGRIGDGVTSEPATVGGVPATAGVGGATTDNWVVMGKLADPNAVSLPANVDFGNSGKARTRTVRMINMGTGPVTLRSATLTGSKAITKLASSTCAAGKTLAIGARCTVDLRYRPGAKKRAVARLHIADSGGAHVVKVSALSSAVMKAPGTFSFAPVRAHAKGKTRRVVVKNTGGLPMKVRSLKLAGRNAGSFDVRTGSPRVCARGTRVPAGATCAVYLGFEPTSFGPKKASLVIRTNALPASHTVKLSGAAR